MKTLATDINNDLLFQSNEMIIFSDLKAIEKVIEQTVKMNLGEDVFNTDTGTPFFDVFFVSNPNIPLIQSILSDTILNVNGVISIDTLDVFVSDNQLSYNAIIETIYGSVALGL